QSGDVHLDRVGLTGLVQRVDVIEQLALGHDSPGPVHHVVQNAKFPGGKINRLTRLRYGTGRRVEFNPVVPQDRTSRADGAPRQRAEAGQDLLDLEGLLQVVV